MRESKGFLSEKSPCISSSLLDDHHQTGVGIRETSHTSRWHLLLKTFLS